MSPAEAFNSGGRNPQLGVWVRDWYALVCTFLPTPVRHEEGILVGMRVLACLDMASRYAMHHHLVSRKPDVLRADDVIQFLTVTIAEYGLPKIGIIVSHSTWQSSTAMLLDEDTAVQGEFLRDNDIEFGPMSHEDIVAIKYWAAERGILCEFNANNVPPTK